MAREGPAVILYVRINLFWAVVNTKDTIAYLFLHGVVSCKGGYEIFAGDFSYYVVKCGRLITFRDTPGEASIGVNGWFAVLEGSHRIALVVNVPLVLVMARLFYWRFLSKF